MNETVKRVILLCGTGAVLLAGKRAVPVMEAVTIGRPPETEKTGI